MNITQYIVSQLVFSDKFTYDKRTLLHRYRWSLTGNRAIKSTFFVREKRYLIEGALCINGLLAYGIQEGPMTSHDYEHFIEQILVCIFYSNLPN